MYKPIQARGQEPSRAIGLYLLSYRENADQIMVRLPRGTLLATGWKVGDKVDVEFDRHKQRLRLTRKRHGAFKIGGKGKTKKGSQREGRLRWIAQPGRPTIREAFSTENWMHRTTDDAIVINVKNQMEIAA